MCTVRIRDWEASRGVLKEKNMTQLAVVNFVGLGCRVGFFLRTPLFGIRVVSKDVQSLLGGHWEE